MAKKPPTKPPKKNPGPLPPKKYPTPPDWVSGSKKPGEKYEKLVKGPGFAKPDFGKKRGPGIPYQTKTTKVPNPPKPKPKPRPRKLSTFAAPSSQPQPIARGRVVTNEPAPKSWQTALKSKQDFKTAAIRKRLGGM